uniref:NADH dehydrogenase subunit 6 n=1 Tax=Hermissenda emurai TaxID=1840523 RepID=A0A6H0N1F2_9GAST|nr:NADH dehydrogenase subunit 6 [Hermissenda emurai]QIV24368.1 NADH dehydrogenase subunit 6 [Hermissenda emurai]
MNILTWACASTIFVFPFFSTPVSLIGGLMTLSLLYVGVFSMCGSFWYSYILFLIYVGGLLVLFIYVCLVSSNVSVSFDFGSFIYIFLGALICSGLSRGYPLTFLGQSQADGGSSLVQENLLGFFLFLVILLLLMLLVVVRVSGVGSAIKTNEV